MPSRPLIDLHDATLVSIHLDWASGIASMVLRASPGVELHLTVSDCTELVVPRHGVCGRSVSVLSASFIDGEAEGGVVVEMQSGDRLVVRGRVQAPVLVPSPG
jgi:hypothetical protein